MRWIDISTGQLARTLSLNVDTFYTSPSSRQARIPCTPTLYAAKLVSTIPIFNQALIMPAGMQPYDGVMASRSQGFEFR